MKIASIGKAFPKKSLNIFTDILVNYKEGVDNFNLDKSIHFIKDILGKETVYELDPESESILSLAVEACKDCLSRANTLPTDIDMIIFTSIIPEYVSPPTSVYIHHELGCREDVTCMDTNANCAGMLIGYNQVDTLFKGDSRLNKVLIVSAEYLRGFKENNNIVSDACFSDSATALLLERSDQSGLIDYQPFTLSENRQAVIGPAIGFTKLAHHADFDATRVVIGNVPSNIDTVLDNIHAVLERSNVKVEDIDHFYFSQFTLRNSLTIAKALNIPQCKLTYIGDKLGYTGASSPFLALEEDMRLGKTKENDLCLFWTFGAGTQHVISLLGI